MGFGNTSGQYEDFLKWVKTYIPQLRATQQGFRQGKKAYEEAVEARENEWREYFRNIDEKGIVATELEGVQGMWEVIAGNMENIKWEPDALTFFPGIKAILILIEFLKIGAAGGIFSTEPTEQEKIDQLIYDRIVEKRYKESIQPMIDAWEKQAPLYGKIRIAWKEGAHMLFWVTQNMIDQWLYGRQGFRCNVVCGSKWYQPYTDCSICETPLDKPKDIEDVATEEVYREIDEEEKRRKGAPSIPKILSPSDVIDLWEGLTRQAIRKTSEDSPVYSRGLGYMDMREMSAKARSRAYLNFITMMKFCGRRGRLAKGFYEDEPRFWAEILIRGKWLIFDFDSIFTLKKQLRMGLGRKRRKKYIKTSTLNLNNKTVLAWLQREGD